MIAPSLMPTSQLSILFRGRKIYGSTKQVTKLKYGGNKIALHMIQPGSKLKGTIVIIKRMYCTELFVIIILLFVL